MCMPTKDQVIEAVRQCLNEANHWVFQNTPEPRRNVLWTRPVKTALCNACRAAWGACVNPIFIRATDVGYVDPGLWQYEPNQPLANRFVTVEPGDPGRAADRTEWLYDVICLQGTWPVHQKVLLVAESEFGGKEKVLEDFAKLLVARAQVRVLVCDLSSMPDVAVLAGLINQCEDTQPGDTYLLAAFGDPPDIPRIVYYRIDAHIREAAHQCELAPIAGDYYPGWAVQLVQV